MQLYYIEQLLMLHALAIGSGQQNQFVVQSLIPFTELSATLGKIVEEKSLSPVLESTLAAYLRIYTQLYLRSALQPILPESFSSGFQLIFRSAAAAKLAQQSQQRHTAIGQEDDLEAESCYDDASSVVAMSTQQQDDQLEIDIDEQKKRVPEADVDLNRAIKGFFQEHRFDLRTKNL